jgi:hypothetical protein
LDSTEYFSYPSWLFAFEKARLVTRPNIFNDTV